jgi:hypothetical protein
MTLAGIFVELMVAMCGARSGGFCVCLCGAAVPLL